MPRNRRPAITTGERARWLADLESGRGITAIARAAGRDIRVVKRHVEMALQEKEVGLALRDFIRSRVEHHQGDLLFEVARLKEVLIQVPPQSLVPNDAFRRKVHDGLKEHLRRLPVLRLVDAVQAEATAYLEVRTRLFDELRLKEQQLVSSLPIADSLYPWANRVVEVLESRAWSGSSWERPYVREMLDEGQRYRLSWGDRLLTRLPVSQADLAATEQAHRALCTRATSLVGPLQERVGPLRELAARVRDELDVFSLRRVVPGRCRYCPV